MVLRQICEILHLNEEDARRKHPDLWESRMLCSEKDVQSLVEVLQSSWVHPFSVIQPVYFLPVSLRSLCVCFCLVDEF